MFDLVIVADWSAEQGRKPSPQENRCWLAWGTGDHRSEPAYIPTRLEAVDRILAIIDEHPDARTIIGFDFAIGYPLADDGRSVLPSGRQLVEHVAPRILDDRSGVNNRFRVAADLNAEIRRLTNRKHGPFWGLPNGTTIPGLTPKRPADTGVRKLRAAEIAARKQTPTKPKSAWQLTGAGAVGSQSLVGLAAVKAVLDAHPDRAQLWPFDTPGSNPRAITVAEIYPSMFEARSPDYWYKDARQAVDTRDAILDHPDQPSLLVAPEDTREGWILGIKPPTGAQNPVS